MVDPNRALFESVVRLLAPVLDDLVFVGGCTTGLFITDPAAAGTRPTVDVDAIVDIASYAGYAALADRLRALGLGEDSSPGAPMCRWRRDGVVVDVMPVDERILGFSNRWYPTAPATARVLDLVEHRVRVVTLRSSWRRSSRPSGGAVAATSSEATIWRTSSPCSMAVPNCQARSLKRPPTSATTSPRVR